MNAPDSPLAGAMEHLRTHVLPRLQAREVERCRTDAAYALALWANRPPGTPHLPGLIGALRDIGYHHATVRDHVNDVLAHRAELLSIAPAEPPADALTLYRGAVRSRAAGASWTPDAAAARMHAYDWAGGEAWPRAAESAVYRAVVPPERLLQRLTLMQAGGWALDEYIVDTEGLQVDELPPTGRPHAALVAEMRSSARAL